MLSLMPPLCPESASAIKFEKCISCLQLLLPSFSLPIHTSKLEKHYKLLLYALKGENYPPHIATLPHPAHTHPWLQAWTLA